MASVADVLRPMKSNAAALLLQEDNQSRGSMSMCMQGTSLAKPHPYFALGLTKVPRHDMTVRLKSIGTVGLPDHPQ